MSSSFLSIFAPTGYPVINVSCCALKQDKKKNPPLHPRITRSGNPRDLPHLFLQAALRLVFISFLLAFTCRQKRRESLFSFLPFYTASNGHANYRAANLNRAFAAHIVQAAAIVNTRKKNHLLLTGDDLLPAQPCRNGAFNTISWSSPTAFMTRFSYLTNIIAIYYCCILIAIYCY